MAKKCKIGILISGSGTNMMAIVRASQSGVVDFEPAFVGSDNPEAKGLVWAKENGLPTFIVDYKTITANPDYSTIEGGLLRGLDIQYLLSLSRRLIPSGCFLDSAPPDAAKKWLLRRAAFEHELLLQIKRFDIDLLVLAGFMRNLTPLFIAHFSPDPLAPRIMNIHPALLPSFPGTDGYGDTIHHGCKVGGCTVHFVDYGEDTGPIIGQRAIPVDKNDTIESFRKKGLQQEYILYPECIQLFAEGRLRVVEEKLRDGSNRKVVILFP